MTSLHMHKGCVGDQDSADKQGADENFQIHLHLPHFNASWKNRWLFG